MWIWLSTVLLYKHTFLKDGTYITLTFSIIFKDDPESTAPECTSWAPWRICLCPTERHSETACRAQGPGPPPSAGSSPPGTQTQVWAGNPGMAATAVWEGSPTVCWRWRCSWTTWSLVYGKEGSYSLETLRETAPRSGDGDEGEAPHMPWSLFHKKWWMLSVCRAAPLRIRVSVRRATSGFF